MARTSSGKIRYAVVGLGHIAQAAVLPAFRNVENAELAALVSNSPDKLRALSELYGVRRTCSYDQFDKLLASGDVDAVYIAVPNAHHHEFTLRAAYHGVHVLCEKPMAVTSEQCAEMVSVCSDREVKLMIAYRLHFEAANLKAIQIAQSGALGDLRLFDSVFTMQVREGNIRVKASCGGGSLYDIGVYCINAARYVLRDEPLELFAWEGTDGDSRFQEVDEMMSVSMRFPRQRLANFVCSFNAPDTQYYTVAGTSGVLRVDPAYDYALDLRHYLTINGNTEETTFPRRDQFGPELSYFADCILTGRDPEPDGWEGLQDVTIIEAIQKSAASGMPVKIQAFQRSRKKPCPEQQIDKPPVEEPDLVGVQPPTRGE